MNSLHERRDKCLNLFFEKLKIGSEFFTDDKTRRMGSKLYKSKYKQEGRRHYFFYGSQKWNDLQGIVVNSTNVNSFKSIFGVQ